MRTRLQHYWATAVEAAGEIYGLDLKTPKPDGNTAGKERDIRDFFKAVSAAFALEEGTPPPKAYAGTDEEVLAETIRSTNGFMTILNDLEASADTIFPIPGIPGMRIQDAGLYLLQFSRTEQILNMNMFPAESLDAALRAYQKAEDAINGESAPFDNVVLVYAQNPEQLELAYPNYSSNVQKFVAHVKNFIQ